MDGLGVTVPGENASAGVVLPGGSLRMAWERRGILAALGETAGSSQPRAPEQYDSGGALGLRSKRGPWMRGVTAVVSHVSSGVSRGDEGFSSGDPRSVEDWHTTFLSPARLDREML